MAVTLKVALLVRRLELSPLRSTLYLDDQAQTPISSDLMHQTEISGALSAPFYAAHIHPQPCRNLKPLELWMRVLVKRLMWGR